MYIYMVRSEKSSTDNVDKYYIEMTRLGKNMTHKVTKRHVSFTICSSQIGNYVKKTTYWKIKLVASSLCHVRVNI